jgi:peptidoglycan/xylan/chitin deacetylase (PgdA/CDA1 family)
MRERFAALMYHRLIDSPESKYDVTPQAFESQLSWLREEGFTVDGFAGLARRCASGPLPERYAVLTFDDGHRSALQAAEIVSRFGVGATFFITKRLTLERPEFVKPDQIRQLSSAADVGAHGVTHRPLSRIPIHEARSELVESKLWLEDLLGQSVTSLSLPGGFGSEAVLDAARRAGYELLGNSREWWNKGAAIRATGIVNRIVVQSHYGPHILRRLLQLDWRAYLPRRLRYELSWNIANRLPPSLSSTLIRVKHRLVSSAAR